MIRFSLLQFRAQAIVAVAGLVIAAIVLAVTGLQLAHLYDSSAFCNVSRDRVHKECGQLPK